MALKGAVKCLVSSAVVCFSEQTMTMFSFNFHVWEGINTHNQLLHSSRVGARVRASRSLMWFPTQRCLMWFSLPPEALKLLCQQQQQQHQTICLFWKAELTNYSNIPAADVFMSELVMEASGKSDGWWGRCWGRCDSERVPKVTTSSGRQAFYVCMNTLKVHCVVWGKKLESQEKDLHFLFLFYA